MPNYCYYQMKIKGSQESCDAWLRKMKSYDETNHFYRIFTADIDDEGDIVNQHYVVLSGECAWSLASCCRASGYSNGVDLFEENTRNLDLVMEAYSQEPGIGFQEHYIYDHGKCVVDDCEDWSDIFWDKSWYASFEKFKEDWAFDDAITEEDFDEDGHYYIGGFPKWGEFVI